MTCICGHHEAVHRAMCGAPEGCSCNKFVPATPLPAKRLAEMTGAELADWWFAQNRNAPVTMAALRDAIRAERDAEWGMRTEDFRTRAEKAEQAVRVLENDLADTLRDKHRIERERDDTYAGQKHHKAKAEVYLERARTAEQERDEWKAMHLTETSKRIGAERELDALRYQSVKDIETMESLTDALNKRNVELRTVDHARAKQDAEWLAGSEADTAERNLARAYLAGWTSSPTSGGSAR
jgi:hypothetical protein